MEFNYQHFVTIDSTNTWAKINSHLLPKQQISLITADQQTGGRGRFNRHWVSPAGQNIYATFCFFVEQGRCDIGNMPQVLALSAVKVLEARGFKAELKWPNDLLIGKKKVAGILAETTTVDSHLCVVIGIGININMPLDQLQAIDRPATSLYVEGGKLYPIDEILKELQGVFAADLERFFKEGFAVFLPEYRERLMGKSSKMIRFNDNKVIWEGTLKAINDDGSIKLQLPDGTDKTFLVGEILWPL